MSLARRISQAVTRCSQCEEAREAWGGDMVCRLHATQRGWQILWDHLDATQRHTLWWQGVFFVQTRRLGWWMVMSQMSSNLFELDPADLRRSVRRHCVILQGNSVAVLGDQLLAQWCWLHARPSYLKARARSANTRVDTSICHSGLGMSTLYATFPKPPPRPVLVPGQPAAWALHRTRFLADMLPQHISPKVFAARKRAVSVTEAEAQEACRQAGWL